LRKKEKSQGPNQVTRVDIPYSGNVFGPKGKAIPLQAWRGPEGSRRLRLPDFKTIGT
jgi:hypothetical protein